MPTGVFERSIETKRKQAQRTWEYYHKEKKIWSKNDPEVSKDVSM